MVFDISPTISTYRKEEMKLWRRENVIQNVEHRPAPIFVAELFPEIVVGQSIRKTDTYS